MGADSWQTYRLGECVNFLSGGTPSKSNPAYWGGNIPWVTCKDMKVTRLHDSQDHLTETGSVNSTRLVEPGTILIVVRGMILAQHFPVAMAMRRVAFNQDLKALQCAPNVDPQFLFYWLQGNSYEILGLADEAAHGTKRLQTDRLQNFPVHLPPLPTEQKIAAIFLAYDDLIENNTRRIKILEEMARSLYREWFVHFRFPGHEQVKMVDSELGLIPEGWQVKGIGEVIETLGGGTPSTKEPKYWQDGDLLWYTPSDLTSTNTMFIADSEKKITALGLQKSSARMFPPYSVMLTSRATIGVVAINTKAACTNQGFITCIPNKQLSAYQIYFWLAENKDKIISFASGATFKEINKTTFRKLPIILADEDTTQIFVKTLNPIFYQIENFQNKNINLCCTRDLLLPKLISGQIDVEKLDINITETAA